MLRAQIKDAYMALNCLFWGFVGAFDYLTAKR